MHAHRTAPDSAPALIDKATDILARVSRAAIHARPEARLHLMGELALVETALETVEREIVHRANAALKAVPKRRALPHPKKRRTV